MSSSEKPSKLIYDITTVNTITSMIALMGAVYLYWTSDKQTSTQLIVTLFLAILVILYIYVTMTNTIRATVPIAATDVDPMDLQAPCDTFILTDFYWNFIATPLFLIILAWTCFVIFDVDTIEFMELQN